MFFFLSKLLDFLISPITWIIILACFAVFSKNQIRKNKFIIATLISIVFFTNPFILSFSKSVIPACENVLIPNKKHQIDFGIILGGMIAYDESKDRILFNSNINRLTQTVELYKKGTIKKILITGGSGSIAYPEKREASLLKKYCVDYFQIPSKDIIIENLSNNTYENAVFSKRLIKKTGLTQKKFILITSQLHQYRAQACFKKQDIKTYIYTYERKNTREKWMPKNVFLPQAEILFEWNNFLHELIGVITYKCMGYI
ncbi:MAG: YdcF family protein [Crocinitomicaceae bacterium]|nr:YdcF family protein [Crocinitomicaceae bacterium]